MMIQEPQPILADLERAAGRAVLAQAKPVGPYLFLAELVRRTSIMRRQLADRLDVELLRSSSQPGQDHVLDHPRTQWRHGGLLSLMVRRALSRRTASTKYTPSAITPSAITPDSTPPALGDSRSVQQGVSDANHDAPQRHCCGP